MEWVSDDAAEARVVDAATVPGAPVGTRAVAIVGDDAGVDLRRRAAAIVRELASSPRPAYAIDVYQPARVGAAAAVGLADAVLGIVAADRRTDVDVAVAVTDGLVRDAVRRAGAGGGLRAPWLALPATRTAAAAPEVDASVEGLLPGAAVERRRTLFGVPVLTVRRGDAGSVRVRLPRSRRLMGEPIAAAVDTLLAVRERFGRAAEGVHGLSFDNGGVDLAHGRVAGQAEGASGVIVLAPSFAAADAESAMRRARAVRGDGLRPALSGERPMAHLDEVVAHECWHYLDAAIRTSGGSYVELNRALGEALGVDSLELALRGRERGAPPEWRAAHSRLVEQVSEYAATNPREATAEMFSQWWCRADPSPVVVRFGELVERYL